MKYYNTPVDYDGHHFDSKADRDPEGKLHFRFDGEKQGVQEDRLLYQRRAVQEDFKEGV